MVILAGRRMLKEIEIKVENVNIRRKKCIKYLEIYLKTNMIMGQYIRNVAEKAGKAIESIIRLLPNIEDLRDTVVN